MLRFVLRPQRAQAAQRAFRRRKIAKFPGNHPVPSQALCRMESAICLSGEKCGLRVMGANANCPQFFSGAAYALNHKWRSVRFGFDSSDIEQVGN